jgi:hypothetical protein
MCIDILPAGTNAQYQTDVMPQRDKGRRWRTPCGSSEETGKTPDPRNSYGRVLTRPTTLNDRNYSAWLTEKGLQLYCLRRTRQTKVQVSRASLSPEVLRSVRVSAMLAMCQRVRGWLVRRGCLRPCQVASSDSFFKHVSGNSTQTFFCLS